MVALLKVERLTKRFGGVTAVADLSFQVEEGEILGLIGPNGAGKSTLFSLLSGMTSPTSGRIFFNNRDITRWAPHRRVHHGLVQTFQLAQPFPTLTVEDNVKVGATFGGRHRRADRGPRLSVSEVLELTDLADHRSTRAIELNMREGNAWW